MRAIILALMGLSAVHSADLLAQAVLIPKPTTNSSLAGPSWSKALGLSPKWTTATTPLRPLVDSTLSQAQIGPGTPLHLSLDLSVDSVGQEGYRLQISDTAWRIRAATTTGLFYAWQSVRQLLAHGGPWLPQTLTDKPSASWRGLMLDLARNHMPLSYLKATVDRMATLKLNRLHLHLSDDQGWRIEILSHPELHQIGSQSAVGGSKGYMTQDEYSELVDYASTRGVAIVPEIDLPGHTNALTSALPDLRCGANMGWPYTGTEVGTTVICHTPASLKIIGDILGEIAALTPTPWIHFGGDEVKTSTAVPYATTIHSLDSIVQTLGKTAVGWEEITSGTTLTPSTIWQKWNPNFNGPTSRPWIQSTCSNLYLDHPESFGGAGLTWCTPSLTESNAYAATTGQLGLEAALWGELVADTSTSLDRLYPRIIAVSEAAWTPTSAKSFSQYQTRRALLGENWFRTPLRIGLGPVVEIPDSSTALHPYRVVTGEWRAYSMDGKAIAQAMDRTVLLGQLSPGAYWVQDPQGNSQIWQSR